MLTQLSLFHITELFPVALQLPFQILDLIMILGLLLLFDQLVPLIRVFLIQICNVLLHVFELPLYLFVLVHLLGVVARLGGLDQFLQRALLFLLQRHLCIELHQRIVLTLELGINLVRAILAVQQVRTLRRRPFEPFGMLVEVVHLALDGQLKKLHLVLEGLIGELEPRDSVPGKYWVSN